MNSKYGFQFGIAVIASMLLSAFPAFAQPGGMGKGRDMDPKQRLERRLGFLDEKLELTDDQVESLRTVLADAQENGMKWRAENENASRAERRAFHEKHRAETSASIEAILNDAQKKTFQELKDSRGRGWGDFRGKARSMGRHFRDHVRQAGFGSGLRALDLTPEQKEALREILTDEQNEKLDRMLSRRGGNGPRGEGHRGQGFGGQGHGGPGMFLRQLDLSDEQKAQIDEMQKGHRAAAKAWHDANPDATWEERGQFREAHQAGMKTMLENILTDEQKSQLDSLRAQAGSRK